MRKVWKIPVLAAVAAVAIAAKPHRVIVLERTGGYFVGGENETIRNVPPAERIRRGGLPPEKKDPNGEYVKGATYVEYALLRNPGVRWPLVMFPGGGLSAASFHDTPDGRPGWEWNFLELGYSIYLVDVHRTGRSPWRSFPEVETEEPSFRNNRFLWETFRIGPPGSYGVRAAYPNTLFPIRYFSKFAAQAAPYFRIPAEEEDAAYDDVIQRACPCILLLHSAAGRPGLAAAQRWPNLVKAVVAVEPSGAPSHGGAPASRAPHIFLWADHLSKSETDESWSKEYEESRQYQQFLAAAGASTVWLNLPKVGIRGNSHLMMMDSNSEALARLIDQAIKRTLKSRQSRSSKAR